MRVVGIQYTIVIFQQAILQFLQPNRRSQQLHICAFFLQQRLIHISNISMKSDQLEYQGKICGYEVTMSCTKDSLYFHYYEETDPTRLYNAIFSNHPKLSTNFAVSQLILQIFRNFKSFYHYIEQYAEDKKRVQISNAGYVTISFFKTMTKTKKAKIIEFDGRVMVNKEELEQQKIFKSDVIDVKAENAFLKETMNKLEQQYEIDTRELIMMKAQILSKKYKYLGELKADAKQLRHEDDNLGHLEKTTLKDLSSTIRLLKDQIHLLIEYMSQREVQKPMLSESYYVQDDDYEKYGSQFWVVLDQNNIFLKQNYRIDGNTLHKIGVYGKYQVLGRDPLPATGRHYFSLFVQKINWSVFSVGIVNQNRRNYETSYESPQCMSYFAKNGCVWQQGIEMGGGPIIPDGVQIRVMLDMKKETIKWFMDGVEIGSALIGKNLLGKRLVPYVQLNYPQNRVTFNQKRPMPYPEDKPKK